MEARRWAEEGGASSLRLPCRPRPVRRRRRFGGYACAGRGTKSRGWGADAVTAATAPYRPKVMVVCLRDGKPLHTVAVVDAGLGRVSILKRSPHKGVMRVRDPMLGPAVEDDRAMAGRDARGLQLSASSYFSPSWSNRWGGPSAVNSGAHLDECLPSRWSPGRVHAAPDRQGCRWQGGVPSSPSPRQSLWTQTTGNEAAQDSHPQTGWRDSVDKEPPGRRRRLFPPGSCAAPLSSRPPDARLSGPGPPPPSSHTHTIVCGIAANPHHPHRPGTPIAGNANAEIRAAGILGARAQPVCDAAPARTAGWADAAHRCHATTIGKTPARVGRALRPTMSTRVKLRDIGSCAAYELLASQLLWRTVQPA